jgi:hypothetical protein
MTQSVAVPSPWNATCVWSHGSRATLEVSCFHELCSRLVVGLRRWGARSVRVNRSHAHLQAGQHSVSAGGRGADSPLVQRVQKGASSG